jgi:hypothetical protein
LKKYYEYYTDLKDSNSAEKALKEAILNNESDVDVIFYIIKTIT